MEILPGLFKSEFSKITAVLGRQLGVEYLDAAEDIASETFLAALETWPYRGVPPNPTAWLYAVARNKAMNFVNREHVFEQKVAPGIKSDSTSAIEINLDMSPGNITDSQLQMLFAICHPVIPTDAQIGLALRILCGFGIDEIASAFLTNRETINKRLFRAREKLRDARVRIEVPKPSEITARLDTVTKTLYLLFNEGYYSESSEMVLREDLCLEAMRLAYLLAENTLTATPAVNALLALMCFHASRFEARKSNGRIVLYHEQDESKWDRELIAKGVERLHASAQGNELTKYHLEANIAYWHTIKNDSVEKWENILRLYNLLLMTEYSPIVALNRTYALSRVKGNTEAIREAEKLKLDTNPYYFTLLGELYREVDPSASRRHLEHALELARTAADKELIRRKLP